jgi:hypothetical protein
MLSAGERPQGGRFTESKDLTPADTQINREGFRAKGLNVWFSDENAF